MSYILDALKKAERERHAFRVPTLGTVHDESAAPRRIRWPWYAIGALVVVNLVVVLVLMHRTPEPEVAPTPTPTVDSPPAPVVASGSTPPGTADVKRVHEPPGPAVGEVKKVLEPPTPTKGDVQKVLEPPAPAASEVKKILEPPAPAPRAAESPAAVSVPPAPAVDRPPASNRETARRSAPKREPERATPSPTVNLPVAPPTVVEAPARPSTAGPLVALREMPAEFQASVSKLRIDALVYGRGETGGMVFINGRKFVVGDTVTSNVTVERITEDGVVLSSQGQRFLLRQ